MDDFTWWTIFAILILLLTVFTLKLCYRVFSDVYCDQREVYSDEERDEEVTRYKNNAKAIFRDESDSRLMMTKQFVIPQKAEEHVRNEESEEKTEDTAEKENEKIKHEEIEKEEDQTESDSELEALEDQIDGTDELENQEVGLTENKVGSMENLDEEDKEILRKIDEIQKETDETARKIPFCIGGKNNVDFYEMKQKFLMNKIGLTSIDCSKNEKLKRRKNMVSLYIQECEKELEKREDRNE